MDFKTAIKTCLIEKYTTFSGRASRSEYWYFTLFTTIVFICANIIDNAIDPYSIFGTFYLLCLVLLITPIIACGARRLHDIGRSGWWLLIILTGIGSILIFIWSVIAGTKNDNEYGKSTYIGE